MTIRIGERPITKVKDPSAVKIYGIDWSEWLELNNESPFPEIAASEWLISGPNASLTQDFDDFTTTTTQVRLTGGTLGKRYIITNRITTTETPPQTEDISFTVLVQQT